ncbi:cysteine proteinase inhibitor 4 [Brassica rapa]|uniref:Cystatin domain-containing protein n=2 Tax=Brassica TaxID=3705 RepID=M4CCF0_BRACM|nr:cysteine proteinase inhibitor 4 [Brassica rapa]CAF2128484.1 unnamed protein product [Brassica napus]
MKSLICLSLILLPLFSVVEGQLIGGQVQIRVDEDDVVVVAKFAVSEHNRQSKANLVYVNVVNGTYQIAVGTVYRLIISAKDGSHAAKNYEAAVWEKLDGSKILLSFKECKSLDLCKTIYGV